MHENQDLSECILCGPMFFSKTVSILVTLELSVYYLFHFDTITKFSHEINKITKNCEEEIFTY